MFISADLLTGVFVSCILAYILLELSGWKRSFEYYGVALPLRNIQTLTEALLDRIVHNRIDIDMGTDNFRKK